MGRKKKPAGINPFVVNKGISTIREAYIQNIFEKDVNGRMIEVGRARTDINMNAHLTINPKFMDPFLNKKTNHCTMVIFMYIFSNLRTDEDYIELNTKALMLKLGYRDSAINQSVKQLIDLAVLAKKTGSGAHMYWINPLILFRGKRLDYIEAINPQLLDLKKTQTIKV